MSCRDNSAWEMSDVFGRPGGSEHSGSKDKVIGDCVGHGEMLELISKEVISGFRTIWDVQKSLAAPKRSWKEKEHISNCLHLKSSSVVL